MDISQQILSDITIFNKYAKFIPEISRRETWDELVERNMSMHIRKYPKLRTEIQKVFNEFVKTRKVLPSMRSLQFGGTPIELSNNRMYNCAALAADHPDAFSEAIFLLLGGSGVGYSVQQMHVDKLPLVQGPKIKTRRFLIGDSIEGWSDAIKILMESYFYGKSDPVFDYRDIRPKGARLVTSGGKAPGPAPLKICIEEIRAILTNSIGRKLKSLEVHDIMCHLADAVLSGGIRRAAMIALFSKTDMDMMSSKSGAYWELNPQRGRANNSVVLHRNEITDDEFFEIWDRVEESGTGEPGIFWTNDYELLTNPCLTGDTLITVVDHGTIENGKLTSIGVTYQIPLKLLVEQFSSNALPPMVLSYNTKTGKIEHDAIDAAMLTRKLADIIEIELDTGVKIKLTPDHKVYTENRGWIEAKDLTDNDVLMSIYT